MASDSPTAPTLADTVLTVEEAAVLLRVNRKTLYEMIGANQLPGVVRFGRVIRISRLALESWLQGKEV